MGGEAVQTTGVTIPTPSQEESYSSVAEARTILDRLLGIISLHPEVDRIARERVRFVSRRDLPYFPIPFKETEVGSALKAIEGSLACAIADLRKEEIPSGGGGGGQITVSLERTTAFLFQAYLATVGGLGKLDEGVKSLLKDTDLLRAQSDPYRRMSANLYETKRPGEYYHIHGSLEASTTLRMIGLESFRPDLGGHDAIVAEIESHVKKFTTEELEDMNIRHRQAGIPVLKHGDFLKTAHGKTNVDTPPWSVAQLEGSTPPCPFPPSQDGRPLAGIKVLELSRIIAGPVIGRILAEYGADVLKITSPKLSDVPFFQVDGNMGKHAAELDLKSEDGKRRFEELLADADVVLDGYRPGAIASLGYGPDELAVLGQKRGKGYVYVSENCFGFTGEWWTRPGWQQIADCVSGVAWEQGRFMGLEEPVVPPFPISDYGTGCMGAIAALTGLHNRATRGGSWHGMASLMHYDLLLFAMGQLPKDIQRRLLLESGGSDFLALRHSHSVDQISGTALRAMKKRFREEIFEDGRLFEKWHSKAYGAEVVVVQPVVHIQGAVIGFERASRPNGSDRASWDFGPGGDYKLS